MLSLLHFLEPNLKARKKSSLNKDSLVYLCFWQKRIALWNFLGLVIARACGDGLKYAAKFLRMGNESLLPLNFVNLKLYLSFALFPSCVFLVTHTQQLAFSLVSPCRAKTRTRQFPGREGEDSFPEVSFKRCFMEERSHWGIIDVKLILKGQIKKYGNSIQSKKRKWVKEFM